MTNVQRTVFPNSVVTPFVHTAAEIHGESPYVIIRERLRKAHWDGFHKTVTSAHTRYQNQVLTRAKVKSGVWNAVGIV